MSTATTTTAPAREADPARGERVHSLPANLAAAEDSRLSQREKDYIFDLYGFRVLRGALSADQLRQINAWVDDQPSAEPDQWLGHVQAQTYRGQDGVNYQNIYEGGPVFEELIDHPAWIEQARRYISVGHHKLSIDEAFLNVRGQGGYIRLHSGGSLRRFTSLFRNHAGQWMLGQINMLMALQDIGPGDGPTTVVPASHKAVEPHPNGSEVGEAEETDASGALGMIEVYLSAGDVLMFSDGLCHGSAARTNPGHRRIMVYRYSPHLLAPRFNYIPSEELLQRLTPERRKIIEPIPPRMRPGRTLQVGSEG